MSKTLSKASFRAGCTGTALVPDENGLELTHLAWHKLAFEYRRKFGAVALDVHGVVETIVFFIIVQGASLVTSVFRLHLGSKRFVWRRPAGREAFTGQPRHLGDSMAGSQDVLPPRFMFKESAVEVGTELGRGSFGSVHAGKLNGLTVCVKVRRARYCVSPAGGRGGTPLRYLAFWYPFLSNEGSGIAVQTRAQAQQPERRRFQVCCGLEYRFHPFVPVNGTFTL